MIELAGYRVIESIESTEDIKLYRISRIEDGLNLIAKTIESDNQVINKSAVLKYEYERLQELNGQGSLVPFRLLSIEDRPMLLMHDNGGITLHELMKTRRASLKLSELLKVAIAMIECLHQVHLQQMTLHHITPYDLIVSKDLSQAKLLDVRAAKMDRARGAEIRALRTRDAVLPYLSPEQTGRTGMVPDYRTDIYSFGVLLYEWFADSLPFPSQSALDTVYAHLTAVPQHITLRNKSIPEAVSAIVMKCLEKMPEERYASAFGIKSDLEECLIQLRVSGRVRAFPLAQHDILLEWSSSELFVGRSLEQQHLLEAVHRVMLGTTEAVWISGAAGIGKSALVRGRLHKHLSNQAIFVSGQMEQVEVARPYEIWLQIVEQLITYLLADDTTEAEQWKARILDVLHGEGQLQMLLNQVPLLKLLLGEQVEPEQPFIEEPPILAQALQQLFQLVCSSSHILVIFLDSVHELDEKSLQVIPELLSKQDKPHMLLIGAYRDDEVQHEEHSWNKWQQRIAHIGISTTELHLTKLEKDDYRQIVSHILHTAEEDKTEEFIDILYYKTEGNPLYLKQFLQELQERQIVIFNEETRTWRWDIQLIAQQRSPMDVIDTAADRLAQLPDQLLSLLGKAAFLGEQFELHMLAEITGLQPHELFKILQPAVDSRIIYPILGERLLYGFEHSRIRQLAYETIAEGKRSELHMTIGMLLKQRRENGLWNGAIEELVDHLNQCALEIIRQGNSKELAQWNIQAGLSAKQANAITEALNYFRKATELLKDSWEQEYELTSQAYLERAKAEFNCTYYEEADALFQLLLSKAQNDYAKAQVYLLMISLEVSIDKFSNVISSAEKALDLLGVKHNFYASWWQLFTYWSGLGRKLKQYTPTTLAELPPSDKPWHQTAMTILDYASHANLMIHKNGWAYTQILMLELTIDHGLTPEASTAFVGYALMLHFQFFKFDEAYHWGKLGCQIAQGHPRLYAQNVIGFSTCVHSWKMHDPYFLPAVADQAYEMAVEAGELWQANETFIVSCGLLFQFSYPLKELYDRLMSRVPHLRGDDSVIHERLAAVFARMLTELTGYRAANDPYGEIDILAKSFIEDLPSNEGRTLLESIAIYHYVNGYILGRYDEAEAALQQCAERFTKEDSYLSSFSYDYYKALLFMERREKLSKHKKAAALRQLRLSLKLMKKLVLQVPNNLKHKYIFIHAVKAALSDHETKSELLFEQAIDAARASGYMHDQAIIAESFAKYAMRRGRTRLAKTYMTEAYEAYSQWGATVKANDLQLHYGSLLNIKRESQFALERIDYLTVAKSVQVLSSEMEMDKLLQVLMHIMLQNAGAEYGALIVYNETQWMIEAYGTMEELCLDPVKLEDGDELLPTAVISYAVRTREAVVLHDAASSVVFERNQYIKDNNVKSVLCLPILYQSKLIGLLYMENRLSTKMFTEDHLDILQLLSSQCAISLVNAKLYSDIHFLKQNLEQQVVERTVALEKSMRATSEALAEATIYAERSRIAGEIHDIVGHTLTSTILQIEAGKRLLQKDKEDAIERFQQAQSLIRQSLSEIRNSVHMLKENHYYDIESALRELIREDENNTGIKINAVIEPMPELPFTHKKAIYHALQEGITNAVRHGRSTELFFHLQVNRSDDIIQFKLEDNGQGCDGVVMGFGLSMMQDRVKQLKGTLSMQCALNQGCCLYIELPYS